jgi:NAD(P)-dependent dehydrogenase (short-subunit alcohol dehydrogenase family)/acyl carrier protein
MPLEDQVAFRSQTRYVARLAPFVNQATSESRFRSDSSYLITGGLGGLGLKVARFMVERGARHLILVGRSGAKPSAQEELSVLSELGTQLIIAKADVSDREQVAQVLNQISPEVPLRGIMHLAGVLDDGVLQQQSWQRFAKVLTPKALGAWNLHTLTQNHDLDFFVLFSSITSLLGNAGQANYAAANAFLDGLASYRQAQGLPALSINWGSWAEVGMSARLELDEWLSQKGEGVIPPAQGLEALAHLLDVQAQTRANAGSIGVMPIEWPRFLAQLANVPPYLAHFAPLFGAEKASTTFRDQLEATALQKREALLEKHVREQVTQILGLAPSMYLEPETGFFALGMDSLSSIEFRNLLQSSLGCSLPTTLLFDYPTPKALVAYLAQELLPKEEVAVRRLPVGQEHETDEEDEMSSIDDMAQLLAAKLGMEL